MDGLATGALLGLAGFGLVAGVGITAVGPGGVLATVGLFVLTGLSPAAVSGTAIVTHVATGALGTLAYRRSGQLREPANRRIAVVLAGTAVIGTPIGVLANGAVSGRTFAWLLGAVVTITGVLVWVRERRGRSGLRPVRREPPMALIAAIGVGVGVAAGLFGIGGPMLSVPLLVLTGVPILGALAAAQAQSVIVAATGTIAYGVQGAIDWPLAALIGVPEFAGVLIGWRLARAVPTHRLTYVLGGVLIALGPYLALHG